MECPAKDRDALAPHHEPIESTFATVRLPAQDAWLRRARRPAGDGFQVDQDR